jgi:hypothetical protein
MTGETPMNDVNVRLVRLEQRIRHLEDVQAIQQLIGSYGPAVDSGMHRVSSGLFEEDGVYDVDGRIYQGHDEISSVVLVGNHQVWMERGCGHLNTLPLVTIDGDTAVALCYTQLSIHDSVTDLFQVQRVSANKWDLIRTEDGWKVKTRTIRRLDGRSEGRELFEDAMS